MGALSVWVELPENECRRTGHPNASHRVTTRTRRASDVDAAGLRGARRTPRRHPAVRADDDRSAVVASALQPAGHLPRHVRRPLQRHPRGRRHPRGGVRAPRAPRPRPPGRPRRPPGLRLGRPGLPHHDRRQSGAGGMRSPQRQPVHPRQCRCRYGPGLRRPPAHLAGAPAPDAAAPAPDDPRHLRMPVRRRMAVRRRHHQPRPVRSDRLQRDVRLVGRLHPLPGRAGEGPGQPAGRPRRSPRRVAGAGAGASDSLMCV